MVRVKIPLGYINSLVTPVKLSFTLKTTNYNVSEVNSNQVIDVTPEYVVEDALSVWSFDIPFHQEGDKFHKIALLVEYPEIEFTGNYPDTINKFYFELALGSSTDDNEANANVNFSQINEVELVNKHELVTS